MAPPGTVAQAPLLGSWFTDLSTGASALRAGLPGRHQGSHLNGRGVGPHTRPYPCMYTCLPTYTRSHTSCAHVCDTNMHMCAPHTRTCPHTQSLSSITTHPEFSKGSITRFSSQQRGKRTFAESHRLSPLVAEPPLLDSGFPPCLLRGYATLPTTQRPEAPPRAGRAR